MVLHTCLNIARKYIHALHDENFRTDWRIKYARLVKNFKHHIGAEIGVFRGENARCLLNNLPNLHKLYCIDLWQHYPEYNNYPGHDQGKISFNDVYSDYKNNIEPYKDRVETIRMSSNEAIKYVEDDSLDFIFIDANHEYKYIKKDIYLWSQKVKPNGLISGHDYTTDRNAVRYGVKLAVDEIFPTAHIFGTIWWIVKEA